MKRVKNNVKQTNPSQIVLRFNEFIYFVRYKIEDKVFTSKVPEWAKAYLSDCQLESIPGLNEAHNL